VANKGLESLLDYKGLWGFPPHFPPLIFWLRSLHQEVFRPVQQAMANNCDTARWGLRGFFSLGRMKRWRGVLMKPNPGLITNEKNLKTTLVG